MTFGQPLWFWAFTMFPVLLALFARNERRRAKLLQQLVASRLQERLAGTVSVARRRWRFAILLLGLACVIVSLAQPRLGYTWEQSKRKGRDVLIAIDCSRSMLATDLAPNRLGRAKLAAQDFITQLKGDRIGLIAFAGNAFLQAPLTIDYSAVLNSLGELDTTIIPRGGTNLGAAIKEAVEAFGKGESDNRCLVIFTDGEELDTDGIAAAEAQVDKIKIFTVGLGSADGSLIPLPGESGGTAFVKDGDGQIVKSKLDEDRLRKIAEVTGGFYVHLQSGPAEMQQIVRTGLGQMKEQEIDARMSRRPIERYQWPLAVGLVLLASSTLISERKRPIRRKTAVLAAMALGGFVAPPVEAKNSGLEAYERQDYKGAMGEFDRQLQRMRESEALHFNLGAAAYKAGDFGKALEAFAKAVTSADPQLRAAAEYNLGNTLFQRGAAAAEKDRKVREWKDALQHYEQALKVEPQNENAEYNRDVVRKLLEELEKEPPQSEQQKQEEKKDEQKKDEQKKDEQEQPKDQPQKPQDDQKEKGEPQDQQKDQSQQQQKDQQSQKGEGGEPKDQTPEGSQQDKDQQKQEDQKGDKDKSAPQSDEGKEAEKKEAKDDPSAGHNAPQQQDPKKQERPAPSPDEPEKKREGEIQAQDKEQPADPQQEAAAEAQAAAEGKMTEAQAMSLLESLKTEDDRVQLLKPNERRQTRTFRDW